MNAAFVSYTAGMLTLATRSGVHLASIGESLRQVDFTGCLPGFRNFDVIVAAGAGQTGRELRRVEDDVRLGKAQAAARGSTAVARILAVFGGDIESVEPSAAGDDKTPTVEEASDD